MFILLLFSVTVGLPLISPIVLMMDIEHYQDWKDVNDYVRNALHRIVNADSLLFQEKFLPEEV